MDYKVINGKGIIPDNETEIGDEAFMDCRSLQSIVIPDSVTVIGIRAFNGCISLQSIEIPDSVTEIGDYAFYGCTSLKSIVIPNSVTKIGDWAFKDCRSLQSVVITTQEKDPDLSRGRIEYLLHELSAVSKAISLRVPIGCGYAYRHYPAFEGKFQKVIGDIDA